MHEVAAKSCGLAVDALRTYITVPPELCNIVGTWAVRMERSGRPDADVLDESTFLLDIGDRFLRASHWRAALLGPVHRQVQPVQCTTTSEFGDASLRGHASS
ncbi:unnamed protein product [Prorocentrum cordatum]|uniref:Uncharacterized protein n=1 Tax=Prorocentrum cordatum TaxID=2364126 RepID=A0ABN9WJB0_9DINO|nr:unnamed protein product [Polarella glacialis]